MALKIYPNGLRLSIINKNQSKLVSVCLTITSGTQSEKNYEAGVSEFMSRMLLMGTNEHPSKELLSAYAKSNGIVLSTSNTAESVILTALTTTENIQKALDVLCEIVFDSQFDSKSGDIVRASMMADIAKLQENPSYILERLTNQALFYRTGLANPKYGTITTIARMKSQDAKDFLDRVLTPKNTVISIVGDVDADEIYEQVMKTFYSKFIDGGDYKKLKFVAPIEGFVGGERTKNKKLNQSRMFLSFPCLNYKNSRKYALSIMEPLILKHIRSKFAYENYFHSEVVTHELFANNGKLTIETMVDYDSAKKYLDTVVEALKELKEKKLTEQDFELEKNSFIVKFLYQNDKSSDLAISAAREVAVLKQSYSLTSELLKIELLTVSDANKILDEILDFSKLYVAYLGGQIDINTLDYID